ncbi:hypothetical protein [Microbulbifer sp. VAAF005]|uniref:hypothetical protein n=1 Tax=Microbulbifer sp. VAAF005 TaxID=3034230 RepID=UPI0024AD6FCB|nr:hypothetical protein [Microbulbifer sp. VAAF005]WHI46573.1 hypothetical protein P0078_23180 [Microbulbifer sp. VAAF005]
MSKSAATNHTHSSLVSMAGAWLKGKANCGAVFTELVTNVESGEQPDAIGFRGGRISILIECKATRSDFLADKKKPFRKRPELGMGMYRFYLCPPGVITEKDLPEKWGLLYAVNQRSIKRVCGGPAGNVWEGYKDESFWERNIHAEWDLMYSALRRMSQAKRCESKCPSR